MDIRRALSHGFWTKSRAPAHRFDRDFDAPPGGHHDNGEGGIDRLDARKEIEPFFAGGGVAGVVQIDQRDIEFARLDGGENRGRRRSGLELETFGLEQEAQRLEDVSLVVRNEHAWRARSDRVSNLLGAVAALVPGGVAGKHW